ncbi:hypothetical protein GX50_04728 [[Emmonsia] crescens]|uniref:Uncharacterized protein n=1 Tax=[Emmonsia] crescens TaxID=73230 RepID=A0A2B7ZGK0_9EURO|nr:hypothetical protein GX50_04728 [Emmonsia crescens]
MGELIITSSGRNVNCGFCCLIPRIVFLDRIRAPSSASDAIVVLFVGVVGVGASGYAAHAPVNDCGVQDSFSRWKPGGVCLKKFLDVLHGLDNTVGCSGFLPALLCAYEIEDGALWILISK